AMLRRNSYIALILLILSHLPGQAAIQCDPAPQVKAALDALPEQTPAETNWEFHQKYQAAIRALRERYPGDPFVQREYISSINSRSDNDKVIGEYQSLHEKNPDDQKVAALYAL